MKIGVLKYRKGTVSPFVKRPPAGCENQLLAELLMQDCVPSVSRELPCTVVTPEENSSQKLHIHYRHTCHLSSPTHSLGNLGLPHSPHGGPATLATPAVWLHPARSSVKGMKCR
ncbi:hypothetical protein E2C01_004971 [Portunus trituberculatus]|uniref:Uncharacterized protein n=1 Tax=Portunus trituberculatus TaxID=210409 RepID=A0A5B7CRY3_PORTR|nr:hypothetical protein [Portunus trituberculatus]